RPGDLTLGDHAGQYLVGLSLRPGVPGRNEAMIYLLPADDSAARIPVTVVVDGVATAATTCGPRCRRAVVLLRGHDRVEVRVIGPRGATALFQLPALPAPDGVAVLDRMGRRMHTLRTFRLLDTLASALGTTVRADY